MDRSLEEILKICLPADWFGPTGLVRLA